MMRAGGVAALSAACLAVGAAAGGTAGYVMGHGAGAADERAAQRAELMHRVDEMLAEPRPQAAEPDPEPAPPPRLPDAGPARDAGPPPIVVLRSRVRRNSAGTSELDLVVRNDTRQTIDGFRFEAECFDNFNTPVIPPRWRHASERVRGQSDVRVEPGATRSVGTWSLFDHDGCTKAIATVTQVHFTDNSVWSGTSRQIEDPREADE